MNWQRAVRSILDADTVDLVKLAESAGASPLNFYVGADLSGVDLRGQDLRQLDLTGANLSSAIIDNKTKINPAFDPRINEEATRISFSIGTNLYICIRIFELDSRYTYTGWAIKSLMQQSYFETMIYDQRQEWVDWYDRSPSAQNMVSQQGGTRFSLKLDNIHYQDLTKAYAEIGNASKAFRFAIFVGAMHYWNMNSRLVPADTSVLNILESIKLNDRAAIIRSNLSLGWREPKNNF